LIAELKLAEWRYSMHGQSLVYLLPNHLEFGNWATFLEWREQQGNRASDKIEMCRLTRHYPAEAIKVMRSLSIILSPLASKILPEQALESNRRSTELKQILDEHSNRNITADLASGGKVGGTTQPTPKTDTTLIYLSEAAEFYNIPKSTLSKAAAKSPGEQGYLWSGRKGRRVFLRKNDCQKLAQSRTKLRNI